MSSVSRRQSLDASGRNATAGGYLASESSSRIVIPQPTLGDTMWELVSPLLWKLLVFYLKVFLILASVAMFVITTVLVYSLVYWLVIPKRLHSYPVYFSYQGTDVPACANVTLATRQWEGLARPIREWDRPTPGYDFDVSISLEYPSGLEKREPIMFETLAMLRDHHVVVKTERPFLPTQVSWLGNMFRDFLTMAISGLHLYRDSLTADVMLIDSLPVLPQENLSFIHVCMRKPPLHVYGATLNFVSKLSGFRYLLAHHPILVGVVVVGATVGLALIGVMIAYVLRYLKGREERLEDEEDMREPLSPLSPREDDMQQAHGNGEDNSSGLRRRVIRD